MSHPTSHPTPSSLPHPRTLLAAALLLLAAGPGCGPAPDEGELALGEAAGLLTTSEETGDVGGDAAAGAEGGDLAAAADEEAALATAAAEPPSGVCDFAARRQEVLGAYDADGNGRLSREEGRALREDLARQVAAGRLAPLAWRVRTWAFWRVRWAFDEDGDRTLSPAERTAMVDALEARCERRRAAALERFDADGSGTLSEAERQAAREALRERLAELRRQVLAQYDANGSGVLELSERAALRADRLARAQARRAELLARYDTDGDGRLSTAEALPLREAIQARIAEGRDAE
jgi:Ca2+-binding EF-hand superfamily protein